MDIILFTSKADAADFLYGQGLDFDCWKICTTNIPGMFGLHRLENGEYRPFTKADMAQI